MFNTCRTVANLILRILYTFPTTITTNHCLEEARPAMDLSADRSDKYIILA